MPKYNYYDASFSRTHNIFFFGGGGSVPLRFSYILHLNIPLAQFLGLYLYFYFQDKMDMRLNLQTMKYEEDHGNVVFMLKTALILTCLLLLLSIAIIYPSYYFNMIYFHIFFMICFENVKSSLYLFVHK